MYAFLKILQLVPIWHFWQLFLSSNLAIFHHLRQHWHKFWRRRVCKYVYFFYMQVHMSLMNFLGNITWQFLWTQNGWKTVLKCFRYHKYIHFSKQKRIITFLPTNSLIGIYIRTLSCPIHSHTYITISTFSLHYV